MPPIPLSSNSLHGEKKWFIESVSEEQFYAVPIHRSIATYDKVKIMELGTFRTTLVIDDHIQCSEVDDFIFYESLVHPIVITHNDCVKKVLICGNQNLAAVREIFKYKTVEECWMVATTCNTSYIDGHKDQIQDPRLRSLKFDLTHGLGSEIPDNYFDIVILNLVDSSRQPLPLLHKSSFYFDCITKLKYNGLLVTQAGKASMQAISNHFVPIYTALSTIATSQPLAYTVFIPSLVDEIAFVIISKSSRFNRLSPEEVDRRIDSIIDQGSSSLLFYDGTTHCRIFSLPKSVRVALKKQDRN